MCKRAWWPLLLLVGLLVAVVAWFSLACSLHGQVADAETGGPLVGVALTVAGQAVQSDGQGAFQVRGVRGLPVVQAEAPGFEPLRGALLPAGTLLWGQALMVRLEPDAVAGTALDAVSGRPVAGATVRAGEQEVQTDALGHYLVKRIPRGVTITAQAPYYRQSEPLRYEGQAALDIPLTLQPVTVTVRDLCLGQPVVGAVVTAGGETRQSDGRGQVSFPRLAPLTPIRAVGPGYQEARGQVSPGDALTLRLAPWALCGTVRGQDGLPLADALVLAETPGREPQLTRTDARGEYRLQDVPANATLVIRKAGYRRLVRPLGQGPCSDFQLEPFVAKGIYCAFHLLTPGYEAQLRANLDLIDHTELNAIVLEIKSEPGYVAFQPQLPLARAIGAGSSEVIDLRALLAECERRGIYTIARMAVFEDDLLATSHPEWAVHRPDGSVWRAAGGRAWVDPFRREVWDYNIGLAREAVALGFDEIQLDYVRFPSDGDVGQCRYLRESTATSRVETISAFVAYARKELDESGAFLSADLFGLTTFDPEEKGIGQIMERIAPSLDYVSPMVYPSTYLVGMLGLSDPWRQPYDVVKRSLDAAHRKTSTLIRPWLQHYDDYHGLGITYGLKELQAQKQAARDGGSWGWLWWNILGQYDPALFERE